MFNGYGDQVAQPLCRHGPEGKLLMDAPRRQEARRVPDQPAEHTDARWSMPLGFVPAVWTFWLRFTDGSAQIP